MFPKCPMTLMNLKFQFFTHQYLDQSIKDLRLCSLDITLLIGYLLTLVTGALDLDLLELEPLTDV